MIEITFYDFFEYKYPQEELHELYIMKNGLDEVLYIGISGDNIWNRWFGFSGHILDGGNFLQGRSSVGEKVVDHLPDSWNWKIQLWTLEDCVDFCKNEISPTRKSYDIKHLEPFMIQKLRPSLNRSFNLNPGKDSMPMSERGKRREAELDRIYKEIFENRKWKSDKS